MSLVSVPLSEINAARLESLRENLVAESRTLDYKERLPENEDDKKDLLQDVTAFANSAGGDLIYGVRERRENDKATGEPEAIVGLSLAAETLDQATLRIENMLLDGIEPRVPGTRVLPIRRGGDPPCLLVRVPRSPLGPHMVTYRGARRFYGRGTPGTSCSIGVRSARASSRRTAHRSVSHDSGVSGWPACWLARPRFRPARDRR